MQNDAKMELEREPKSINNSKRKQKGMLKMTPKFGSKKKPKRSRLGQTWLPGWGNIGACWQDSHSLLTPVGSADLQCH